MKKEALNPSTVASAATKRGTTSRFLKGLIGEGNAARRAGGKGGPGQAAMKATSATSAGTRTQAQNYVDSRMQKAMTQHPAKLPLKPDPKTQPRFGATLDSVRMNKAASMNKEAVANLGEEELNFLKKVRLTREDTRRDANDLFTTSHQNRKRDRALLEKLFVQFPGAQIMSNNLLKEASTEQWEQYERINTAYNVHHFFESGAHLDSAQRRFPELLKVAKLRPAMPMKPVNAKPTIGTNSVGSMMSGATV